jgi:hypothetical protein
MSSRARAAGGFSEGGPLHVASNLSAVSKVMFGRWRPDDLDLLPASVLFTPHRVRASRGVPQTVPVSLPARTCHRLATSAEPDRSMWVTKLSLRSQRCAPLRHQAHAARSVPAHRQRTEPWRVTLIHPEYSRRWQERSCRHCRRTIGPASVDTASGLPTLLSSSCLSAWSQCLGSGSPRSGRTPARPTSGPGSTGGAMTRSMVGACPRSPRPATCSSSAPTSGIGPSAGMASSTRTRWTVGSPCKVRTRIRQPHERTHSCSSRRRASCRLSTRRARRPRAREPRTFDQGARIDIARTDVQGLRSSYTPMQTHSPGS